jgi:PTH1 family peptidyl-tRNA hydrolase
MEEKRRLIVGLGNPGSKYEMTRHNLGFLVLKALAQKCGLSFKNEAKFSGALAQGSVEKNQVLLLLPMTYMNLSGSSIRKVAEYYKISFQDPTAFLVVVDDVYLKYMTMRLRDEGSSGGHNGLKSVEESLQTKKYARLRMGIGPKVDTELLNGPPLEDYVLSTFSASERETLSTFVEKGAQVLQQWIISGWDGAVEVIRN